MLKNILILMLFFFIGCNLNSSETSVVQVDPQVKIIAESMKTVKKEDCLIMYKQFSGLSEYLKNSGKNIDTTPKVWALISGFQTQYGWQRETYKEYTDSVEKYLAEKKYQIPRKILSDDDPSANEMVNYPISAEVVIEVKNLTRSELISDMQVLADSAKLALQNMESK